MNGNMVANEPRSKMRPFAQKSINKNNAFQSNVLYWQHIEILQKRFRPITFL